MSAIHPLAVFRFVACIPFLLLAGCNFGLPGNGVSETQSRDVGAFESVSLLGLGDVEIRVGPDTSVEVTVDENLQEYVETTVEGGKLSIRATR